MQFARVDKKTGKITETSRQPINLQQQEGDSFEVMQVEDDANVGDQPRHQQAERNSNPAQQQRGRDNPNPKQGTEGTKG